MGSTFNLYPKCYLHFECEVFLHVLDDHHEVGKFDAEGFPWVRRAGDVGGRDICSHDLQNEALDVRICDSLDVTCNRIV